MRFVLKTIIVFSASALAIIAYWVYQENQSAGIAFGFCVPCLIALDIVISKPKERDED